MFLLLHLYIKSFILVWSQRYLFYHAGLIQNHIISLLKLFQLWPLGTLSGRLFCFFLHRPYFPALQDVPDLSCICAAPALESNISPRILVPFIGGDIRNQDVGAGCVCASWGGTSRPSQRTEQGNACVHTYPSIHKYFFIMFCN